MKVKHSVFSSERGVREDFFAAMSRPQENFVVEFAALLSDYDAAMADYDCSADSEVFLRLHLSDPTNQYPFIEKFIRERNSFVSIVGQMPEGKSRIALEAWHWSNNRKVREDGVLLVGLENYSPRWFAVDDLPGQGSFEQTAGEFAALGEYLNKCGANVADHTVRTWLYCRDVDNNYSGLVQARNRFFADNGLTKQTHFIASTGIEGQNHRPDRLVKMDSLNIPELQNGQMIYLQALDMLSPTTIYGVSFERGTRLVFGDRSHYFISGTASIDHTGVILYPYDVVKQTERVLDNISALLSEGGAEMKDVKSAVVYLRDPADANAVLPVVYSRWNQELPLIILKAPVCRPGWLVEIECIAVNASGNSRFKDFQ